MEKARCCKTNISGLILCPDGQTLGLLAAVLFPAILTLVVCRIKIVRFPATESKNQSIGSINYTNFR